MRGETIKAKKYFINEFTEAYIYSILIHLLLMIINMGKSKGLSLAIVYATNGQVNRTVNISIILIISLLIGYSIIFCLSVTWNDKVIKTTHRCKMLLQKSILSKSLSFLNEAKVGIMIENFTDDLSMVVDFCSNIRPKRFCAVVNIFVYGVYFIYINPLIFVILTGIAALQIVPPVIVKRYFEKYYDDTRNIEAEITEQIIQGYNGLSDIKRQNAKNWVIKRFTDLYKIVYKIDIKNQKLLQSENSMDNLLSNVILYGTYAFIGLLTLKRTIVLDDALKIIVLSSSYYSAYKNIFDSITTSAIAKLAFKRIFTWFHHVKAYDEKIINDIIVFTDFTYKYKKMDIPIFRNLSLSFSCKEIVIVTGENGTGKSTLMKHIVGLISNTKDNVLFCGVNPEHLSDEKRSEYLFYLPQEPPGFSLTPLSLFESFNSENVLACENIAKRFGLTYKNLTTSITHLSGGERKKVYLSLAFSTPTNIYLLLDEPTNFLDQEGINVFKSLLLERQGGALIISHNKQITDLPFVLLRVNKDGSVYEEHIS